MSLAAWYHHKAHQCAQMAKDAIDPKQRAAYEHEHKLWLQIADGIDREDGKQFAPEPR